MNDKLEKYNLIKEKFTFKTFLCISSYYLQSEDNIIYAKIVLFLKKYPDYFFTGGILCNKKTFIKNAFFQKDNKLNEIALNFFNITSREVNITKSFKNEISIDKNRFLVLYF